MAWPDRLAVIEAGSRGVRLLVVEQRPPPEGMAVLRSQGELGLLGEGLDENQGRMRPENIRRTLAHIERFRAALDCYRPQQVVLAGTEVLRRAGNVEEF